MERHLGVTPMHYVQNDVASSSCTVTISILMEHCFKWRSVAKGEPALLPGWVEYSVTSPEPIHARGGLVGKPYAFSGESGHLAICLKVSTTHCAMHTHTMEETLKDHAAAGNVLMPRQHGNPWNQQPHQCMLATQQKAATQEERTCFCFVV